MIHQNLKLTLGFSPCPNDTFMFDAMVHGKIDTEGLEFDVVMEDVETLNQHANKSKLDISKISFATFLNLTEKYQLLNSGSALGEGVGPLLICSSEFKVQSSKLLLKDRIEIPVSKADISNLKSQFADLKVAIPGKNTTANFLFSIFFPEAKNKVEMIFSEIEDAVLSGKADAGVIIHENRFTYEQKGLKKVCDLGELWEEETKQPIPLGGIAVRKNFPEEIKQKIDRVMRKSVEYAFAHPDSSYEYVKQHAQEMDESVRRKHIELYVNKYSVDLGEKGKQAIETLFSRAAETGLIHSIANAIFVEPITQATT